jgi:hypothetical protein
MDSMDSKVTVAFLGDFSVRTSVGNIKFLERETGIEPATNGLGSRYSTIELLPLRMELYRDAGPQCLANTAMCLIRTPCAQTLECRKSTRLSTPHPSPRLLVCQPKCTSPNSNNEGC